MKANNLWILTEERPKKEVVELIIEKFANKFNICGFFDTIRILPILNQSGRFKFTYEIIGFHSEFVHKIYLKTVSGKSSFVDFLVFFQENKPKQSDTPIFAIEETKTDDSESRNTGIFQRATKFVYIEFFYKNIDKTILYNFKITSANDPTETNVFGRRCLRTLGINFIGNDIEGNVDSPWNSIDEMISFKSNMRSPPSTNTPIEIKKYRSKITISGRLIKSGYLAHDPNIGALSLISATLRKLGWQEQIEIVKHGLSQNNLTNRNKMVHIANHLDISFAGLIRPNSSYPSKYWYYEEKSEKLGTIFLHIAVESFTNGYSIYENHAGCERGYFICRDGTHLQVEKTFSEQLAVKKGLLARSFYENVSSQNFRLQYGLPQNNNKIALPDLVLIDLDRVKIINIEGKKHDKVLEGIQQLDDLSSIELFYIKHYYPDYQVIRTVVLYGGTEEKIQHARVSFLLNCNGKMVLSVCPPKLLEEALKNLNDYWNPGLHGIRTWS